ncbi:MAG: lysophospholipid acyltransferase family protein [Eubacteriales bacterium]|nr:lysophospholipid acyltransferase family protein [Eubacteriales bacterium]
MAYRVARALVAPYFVWRFNLMAEKEDPKGPFLLLANHVTELDFALVGAAFKSPLVFVIGDTLLRAPVLGWLLEALFGAIAKHKGIADTGTAMGILRRLRGGQNVCLFPEGNTCFDGRTGPFSDATGGLARAVGATLITYRITGAHLALPRWGKGIRRGLVVGELVGIYSHETLINMTPVEVNALIARDLAVDAFKDQEANPVAYRRKSLAQRLEHALYWCPACGEMGQITSRDNTVICLHCGLKAVFGPYGAFEGGKPFKNPAQWQDSQRARLKELVQAAGEESVLRDKGLELFQRGGGRRLIPIARGELAMSRPGITIGDRHFLMEELVSLEIYRKNILLLAVRDGGRYQLVPQGPFNALKYRDMFQILREDGRQ